MIINPDIFKAYDIRGIYNQDFGDDLAYKLGLAFVALRTKDQDTKAGQILTIAVGADMRLSSPALKEAAIKGLTTAGANVIDLGLVSTPAFYFAVSYYNCDGGLMISASHNPGIWNGFKLTRNKAIPVSGDSGINWLRDLILQDDFKINEKIGTVIKKEEIAPLQMQHDLAFINKEKIKPFKIIADTANGMGIQYLKELQKNLSCAWTFINEELDGSFPNHEADPLKEENMIQLQAEILKTGADLGIATDGDGDRVFFVDNLGQTISPAIIRGLLAKSFLQDKPGAKIGYDIRPGKITEDLIVENGGQAVLTRVGHSLIKEQMLAENLYFAGESSGHFFLNLPIGCFEMPNIMIGKMLEEFSQKNITVAEQIEPLNKYFSSGEINSEVKDKELALNHLKQAFSDGKLSFLDGISVAYPDFWFNVRASNTENKLRLNLEAISQDIIDQETPKILKIIKQ
jgi:phosphomannomutase